MSTGFAPIAEVVADSRARIAFGRAGVRENDRFAVSRNADGEILLIPLSSVPTRELAVWEDDELRASLLRGLLQATAGQGVPRDDFLDDTDE